MLQVCLVLAGKEDGLLAAAELGFIHQTQPLQVKVVDPADLMLVVDLVEQLMLGVSLEPQILAQAVGAHRIPLARRRGWVLVVDLV